MNEFTRHTELQVKKDIHDTELFYVIKLVPKWVRIKSDVLHLDHLIANESPQASSLLRNANLDIEDAIALSEFPLFDSVWFYLSENEAYIIADRSTNEKSWLEPGWYDAKLFTACQTEC